MSKVLSIIYGLLMLLKSWQVKQEQTDAQEQANKIEQDPVDWFNNHFDGGLQQSKSAEASSSKATHIRLQK